MAGVLESAEAGRIEPQTPEHQGWIERYRRKGIACQTVRSAIGCDSRNDRNPSRERAERVSKIPRVDRRMVAGQFVGRVRSARVLRRVGHSLASKRQVFGRQAKCYTTVIGAGGVKIECKM